MKDVLDSPKRNGLQNHMIFVASVSLGERWLLLLLVLVELLTITH